MEIGTKVRTLYQHSERATVVKPRKVNLPMPGPDWLLIRFEDGKQVCCHRSMVAVCNDGAA